jgi:hypothetical protein
MELLHRVERFLRRRSMPPTVLGRAALGDPNFVRELRNGREPGPRTAARVAAFLDSAEAQGAPPCNG